MKTISLFQVIDHGVEHEQYFQGCGVAFTEFQDVATGIGSSAREAFEDAMDMLAQNDWDTETVKARLSKKTDARHEGHYHYVSVRVK